MRLCGALAGAWVVIGALLPGRAVADPAIWDVQYHANSLVYPDANDEGWTFNNNGTGFQRGFVNNTLWEDTMPPADPSQAMGWSNTRGHFNFSTGFAMEATIKMVAATNVYPRWGGAELWGRSDAGYNLTIDVDPDKVILGSIFDYVAYPMTTTDTFHTYRAEAINNQGKLYVDDVLRLQLPLSADNPFRKFWFGDQGWEGGEMYFQDVRYGVLPEPSPAASAVVVILLSLARRRVTPKRAP